MTIYILITIYALCLYGAYRSAPLVDKNDLVLIDAPPIRPMEWAKVLACVTVFNCLLALTKFLLS